MRWDATKKSSRHLGKILPRFLDRDGLDCDVYERQLVQNEYKDANPEYSYGAFPDFTCQVVLGTPFSGLSISNFISVSEKIDVDYSLFTDKELKLGSKVVIKSPSGETLNLRIIEPWEKFALSKQPAYRYVARVGTEEYTEGEPNAVPDPKDPSNPYP